MDIIIFHRDVFLIISHLSPSDLLLSRRVNKRFYAAFTDSNLSRHLLQQHYTQARELKNTTSDDDQTDWARVFAKIAATYHHLKAGPRSIEKLALGKKFPYLALTEAVGTKFSARHFFRLERIFVIIKPNVSAPGRCDEVPMSDDSWLELLRTCGDDRFLIGENTNEEVVILHFDRKGPNPVDL
jgi:hypothetical protein